MITQDNIISKTLSELIATNEAGTRDFDETEGLVQAALFSVFSERRRYALSVLKEIWGEPRIDVMSTEERGITNAYISFVGKDGPYIFIERYDLNIPIKEEVPSAEEMKNWENV